MTVVHVVPIKDAIEHMEIDGVCWCRPEILEECAGHVVVHNSADGREARERRRGAKA